MRRALAIETSTRQGSVALACADQRESMDLEGERSHATDLFAKVHLLLERAGLSGPKDLELVVVGTGPGSFTGLRIGIATALGLTLKTGAKLVGVPSIEALAHASLEPGEEGVVALDARAGGFYFARYCGESSAVRVLEEPCFLRTVELRERLTTADRILGDATVADRAGLDDATRARIVSSRRPNAAALLELGLERSSRADFEGASTVEPLYLRAFGE